MRRRVGSGGKPGRVWYSILKFFSFDPDRISWHRRGFSGEQVLNPNEVQKQTG